MDIGAVQNAMIGMALFDAYSASFDKLHKTGQHNHGDPLIAAAFAAFEKYIDTVETQHAAMIEGVAAQVQGAAGYSLNPQGNGVISVDQMAPFLALNIMA